MSPGQDGGYNFVTIYGANFSGGGGLFDFNTDSTGAAWIRYDQTLTASFSQTWGIGFHLQATNACNGTFYLDNIRIE